MPTRTQRRNTAYLNRRISRFGQLYRSLEDQATGAFTGLAIDLGGSVEPPLRPDDLGSAYLDQLLNINAPLERRARPSHSSFLICAF